MIQDLRFIERDGKKILQFKAPSLELITIKDINGDDKQVFGSTWQDVPLEIEEPSA